MTDSELIKALENKVQGSDYACFEDYEILDLINRQKAEIERLKIENQSLRAAANSYKMHYNEAKSEAIKEFARKLKCGVPQETGVIRCADIDNIAKEMVGEPE